MVTLKKDSDQKIKEKRAKVNAIFKGVSEPNINPLDYKVSLIQALNWYNVYASLDDRKKWFLDTITDKIRRGLLSKLDDIYFRQIGIFIRLKSRDQYLEEADLNFIQSTLDSLDDMSKIVKKVEVVKPKNVISIQDRIKKIAIDFSTEIDGEIDDYIRSGYPKTFTFKNSVKTISGQSARLIPDFYKSQIEELEELLEGNCEQLNESYSHIKTSQVKHFLKLMKTLVASCTQQVVSSKKVRVSKPKAPSVIVAKMKYLIAFPELNIKSVPPMKILDSKEVWLYDSITHKLTFYKASEYDTLTVRGTTILGYNTDVSLVKIVKPSMIKDFSILSKKEMLEQFSLIKSKGNLPTGRTNENTIILRVF